MRCAIVHYHELALKGRNREYFEERLVRNIQWTLKDLGVRRVENLRSRIRVVLADTSLRDRQLFAGPWVAPRSGPSRPGSAQQSSHRRAPIGILFHLSRVGET